MRQRKTFGLFCEAGQESLDGQSESENRQSNSEIKVVKAKLYEKFFFLHIVSSKQFGKFTSPIFEN